MEFQRLKGGQGLEVKTTPGFTLEKKAWIFPYFVKLFIALGISLNSTLNKLAPNLDN